MTAADSEVKYTKAQPILHSGDTSVQGTLALVPRVPSPEKSFYCIYSIFSADVTTANLVLENKSVKPRGYN